MAIPLKCVAVLFGLSPEGGRVVRALTNIGVNGPNPRGLKCDNRKGYIGGWIYPEYSVAWLIPVVGFDS